MEKSEIKPGEPVTIDNITIIPIIKTALHRIESGHIMMDSGTAEIVKLLIINNADCKVLSIDGEELSTEELFEDFPELSGYVSP